MPSNTATTSAAAVADVDLVVETVSETLSVKADVFATLAAAPDDAVLATNTSSIPITDVAATVPDAADRVVGCHWWNPPYLLPTVEVVHGAATSDETVDRTAAFVEAVNREPIRVERDVPGVRLEPDPVRRPPGVYVSGARGRRPASGRGAGSPGRLRPADGGRRPARDGGSAGLELFRSIAANLYPHLSDADEPGPLFEERLASGWGGVADGAGFHEYDAAEAAVVRRRNERVAGIRRALDGD